MPRLKAMSTECLEEAAESLKKNFVSLHYGVRCVYNNLGAASLELHRPQSAAQVFAFEMEIIDVSLSPRHTGLIHSCQKFQKYMMP